MKAHPSQLSHCCTRTVRSLLENATQVLRLRRRARCATTIAPPLDANTRGHPLHGVCTDGKQEIPRAREYATKRRHHRHDRGAHLVRPECSEEWESFEAATARDAAPEALDEELNESDRRAADDFGPEAEARARVVLQDAREEDSRRCSVSAMESASYHPSFAWPSCNGSTS